MTLHLLSGFITARCAFWPTQKPPMNGGGRSPLYLIAPDYRSALKEDAHKHTHLDLCACNHWWNCVVGLSLVFQETHSTNFRMLRLHGATTSSSMRSSMRPLVGRASTRLPGSPSSVAARSSRQRCVCAKAIMDHKNNNKDLGDRVVATLPYLLPLLDGIPYGKFILFQYPFVARALAPLAPLAMVYNSVPFLP